MLLHETIPNFSQLFHKSTRTVQHTSSGIDHIITEVSLFQLISTIALKHLLLLLWLSRYRKP